MILPNPVTNNSLLNAWLNKLRSFARSLELKSGVGYTVQRSSEGTTIQILEQDRKTKRPFQIYQTSTWLKYKVRTGLYVGTGNPITVTNTETEITITSGVARYWIYLDCTATTAEVKSSASTLDWSSSKIPVGWIDTTNTTDSVATIYQLLEDNVFNPCAT